MIYNPKSVLGRINVFCAKLERLLDKQQMQTAKDDVQTAKDDVIKEYNAVYHEVTVLYISANWDMPNRSLNDMVHIRNTDVLHLLYELRKDLMNEEAQSQDEEVPAAKELNSDAVELSHQIDKLRGEIHGLEAWQSVAAESNRNIFAHLQHRFPSLELSEGAMPLHNVRTALSYAESKTSASEALFGFMGWLTSRDKAEIFSGHHNAAPAADLVALFCEVNDLAEPRDGWDKKLVHPKECRPDEEIAMINKLREKVWQDTVVGITAEDRPPSPWRPDLEQILSKLSGDLSQNNVAAAKQILKKMLKEN